MPKIDRFVYDLNIKLHDEHVIFDVKYKEDGTYFIIPFCDDDSSREYYFQIYMKDMYYHILSSVVDGIETADRSHILTLLNVFNERYPFAKFLFESGSVFLKYCAISCEDPKENSKTIFSMLQLLNSLNVKSFDIIKSAFL